MHSLHLDAHSRLNSPIHRLPAGVKLAIALALVLGMVLLPVSRAIWLSLPATLLILLALLSRIPLTYLLRRLLMLELFVVGVALLALFQPDGLRLMGVLILRCTLCLLTMLLLSSTTPFSEIVRILRMARVPTLLTTTLTLMYRYLFVLTDESQRMKRARMSRSFLPGRSHQWRTLGTIISQLFIRASERAERIYSAMCARGWQ